MVKTREAECAVVVGIERFVLARAPVNDGVMNNEL